MIQNFVIVGKKIMLKWIRYDLRVVKEMVMFGSFMNFVRRETGLRLREVTVLKD
jgi:hypothetical protein